MKMTLEIICISSHIQVQVNWKFKLFLQCEFGQMVLGAFLQTPAPG